MNYVNLQQIYITRVWLNKTIIIIIHLRSTMTKLNLGIHKLIQTRIDCFCYITKLTESTTVIIIINNNN